MIVDIIKEELKRAEAALNSCMHSWQRDPGAGYLEARSKRLGSRVSMIKDLLEHPPILFVDRSDDQWPRDKRGCLLKVGDSILIPPISAGVANKIDNIYKYDNNYVANISSENQTEGWVTLHECKLVTGNKCPDCGRQTVVAKGMYNGGGVECTNDDCDYWFCY